MFHRYLHFAVVDDVPCWRTTNGVPVCSASSRAFSEARIKA